MPPLETFDLIDRCVLLEASSYDRHGEIIVGQVPVEIACCWPSVDLVSLPTASDDIVGQNATVHVDRAISISSIMWRGRLADFPADWEQDADGLMEVANYREVPSGDGKGLVSRWVELTSFRAALPEQE